MKKTYFLSLIFILTLSSVQILNAQTKAFPTAEGYGKYATGGRGGVVVYVTNLQDYNPASETPIPGSFRWAFTQGKDSVKNRWGVWTYSWKPLTILFKVGGVIELKALFSSNRGNVTIAGQTALGEGVCFKKYTMQYGGYSNFIIRYMKSRPGDEAGAETSATRLENGSNFIFDHCSWSWGIEETTHFSSSQNLTVQWCILSEALFNSIHKKGERGYASQWGGQYATYHHNLLADNNTRSPRINGANANDVYALVDYRNNVNYNWCSAGACYGGEWEVPTGIGYSHVNFVNNYYKPGPATSSSLYFAAPSYARSGVTPTGYAKWYFNGNYMYGNSSKTENNWNAVDVSSVGSKDNIYSSSEFFQTDGVLENYSAYTQTAENAYNDIISKVGAIYPKRDGIDTRIIGEMTGSIAVYRSPYTMNDVATPVKGTTAGIIDSQWNTKPVDAPADWNPWTSYYTTVDASQAPADTDADGIPDAWETAKGLNPNLASDGNKLTLSGYTALEVYLNSLVGENIELVFNTGINETDFKFDINISVSDNDLLLNTDKSIVRVELIDLMGRVERYSNGYDIKVINISNLISGVYILKAISSDNQISVSKIKL